MKAIAFNFKKKVPEIIEVPEPKIASATSVKMRVLKVGICGTDREIVQGIHGSAEKLGDHLILGHEMLGVVTEVGTSVKTVRPGDLAVFTVRRGCNACDACKKGAYDFCYTGNYFERGIKGLHGFQSEFVIDDEQYLVKVAPTLETVGVLAEPTSVVEKAIREMLMTQVSRLPDWEDSSHCYMKKTALVAGLGPIGLLGAMVLRLRGFNVIGFDILPESNPRVKILHGFEGKYINAKEMNSAQIREKFKQIDIILEAAGNLKVDFNLMEILGINGAYALTGITKAPQNITVEAGTIMHEYVLKNQVMLGSVNASKVDWEMAIADLEAGYKKWPHILDQILAPIIPVEKSLEIFTTHPANEIKPVILWSKR